MKPEGAAIERHEGKVHDRVVVVDDDGDYVGDVTVLAGADETDTVSLMAHGTLIHASFELQPAQAVRLGRILMAAGEDTLSRLLAPKDEGTDESEVP